MATVAPPPRNDISGTAPNPSNAVARAGFGSLWDYVTNLLGITGSPETACTALGAYQKTSILGTVSQSGGVPTGAIIETGLNANGRYTKYADGTLVCTQSSGVSFANSSNLNLTWTYPFVFSVAPNVFANTATANLVVTKAITCVGAYNINTTTASVGIFSLGQFVAGDVTGELVNIQAIGRWF